MEEDYKTYLINYKIGLERFIRSESRTLSNKQYLDLLFEVREIEEKIDAI